MDDHLRKPPLDSFMSETNDIGNVIANCVLKAFDDLPTSRKPRGSESGLGTSRREWVPLAGIVVEGEEPFERRMLLRPKVVLDSTVDALDKE